MNPTPKQQQLLDFIESHVLRTGGTPSYREMRDGLGLVSISGVQNRIKHLLAKGLVELTPGQARSLRVRKPTS